jgi:hypothetical protein
LILRSQLKRLHLFADFVVTVFPSHATIEQFIEIDEPILTFDAHFEDLFFQVAFVEVLAAESKTRFFVSLFTELSEEVEQLFLLDLEAFVPILSIQLPHVHEIDHIDLEQGNHVFFWQVVLFELLNDDEDEQIEHDVGTNQDKPIEIDE